MRDYTKPTIIDEEIELDDIIAVSDPQDAFDFGSDDPEGGDL